MPALTSVGEVGIEYEGRSYLLRPSLFHISQIGSPKEIIEATALLLGAEPEEPYAARAFRRERFDRALTVLYACAGEQDLSELLGGMVPTGRGRIVYSPGRMPMQEIIALAQAMIRHGVLGDVESEEVDKRGGEFLKEFHCIQYAGTAMAHMGMSEEAAWNMTMTTFVRVMRSKYPPAPGPKPHTAADYDATMARLEKINAARRSGKK